MNTLKKTFKKNAVALTTELNGSWLHLPPCTSWRAIKRAVEPVEQLLFTFMMGMPDKPRPW